MLFGTVVIISVSNRFNNLLHLKDKILKTVNTVSKGEIEAIKLRMEQMNLKQQDLVPFIDNKSKISEVLNRKVGLSLNMMALLHLPLEILVQPQLTNSKIKCGN